MSCRWVSVPRSSAPGNNNPATQQCDVLADPNAYIVVINVTKFDL